MRFALGIDIGGTNLVAGAVAEDGSALLGLRTEPTRAEEGADAVVERLLGMARAAIAQLHFEQPDAEVLGVGVGAPGPLDRTRGIVLLTPNLGWVNFPLRDIIQNGLGVAAALDNDANCATLGEWWVGAAKGGRNVVGLTIGTGIGGGLIVNGELYHGSSDVAGEVGHMTIDPAGRPCKCGNRGCLEAYASGTAIAERAREALTDGEGSMLPRMVDGDLRALTAQHVYEAARTGDSLARGVVRETGRFIGAGVANLLNILNPDVVVLAGGVTRAGDELLVPLRAEVQRRAFQPAVDACRIVQGTLGVSAGVIGAAATFLAQHRAPE